MGPTDSIVIVRDMALLLKLNERLGNRLEILNIVSGRNSPSEIGLCRMRFVPVKQIPGLRQEIIVIRHLAFRPILARCFVLSCYER